MIERPSRKETTAPTPLTRLYVLVHPLYLAHSERIDSADYQEVTRLKYSDRSLQKLLPQNPSEMLLVMPLTDNGETLEQHLETMKNRHSWPDLFERLKEVAPIKENVCLAPNIVSFGVTYDPIIQMLEGLSRTINETTEIVLGGEEMDRCVESAAKRLLQYSKTQSLKIDKRVTIHSDPRINDHLTTGTGIVSRQDGTYIYVSKIPISR